MRTRQAKTQGSAAPERRTSAKSEPEATDRERAVTADPSGERWEIAGRARNIRLDAGLHALIVGKSEAPRNTIAGVMLPVTQVASRLGEHVMAIVSNSGGENGWVGAEGGTVVLKAAAGSAVLVTTYGIVDDAGLPALRIVNLDRLADTELPVTAPAASAAPPIENGREIAGELILHIERQGDRRFSAGGWAGNPGDRLRVEGFAIRPLEGIAPGHIEYMAYGPGGRQTPWTTDTRICGTRGRGLPLTGFAVRLAPAVRDRFDVVYEGHFFSSGMRGPQRNGEPCLPVVGDDPLSAIRLRVIERPGA